MVSKISRNRKKNNLNISNLFLFIEKHFGVFQLLVASLGFIATMWIARISFQVAKTANEISYQNNLFYERQYMPLFRLVKKGDKNSQGTSLNDTILIYNDGYHCKNLNINIESFFRLDKKFKAYPITFTTKSHLWDLYSSQEYTLETTGLLLKAYSHFEIDDWKLFQYIHYWTIVYPRTKDGKYFAIPNIYTLVKIEYENLINQDTDTLYYHFPALSAIGMRLERLDYNEINKEEYDRMYRPPNEIENLNFYEVIMNFHKQMETDSLTHLLIK